MKRLEVVEVVHKLNRECTKIHTFLIRPMVLAQSALPSPLLHTRTLLFPFDHSDGDRWGIQRSDDRAAGVVYVRSLTRADKKIKIIIIKKIQYRTFRFSSQDADVCRHRVPGRDRPDRRQRPRGACYGAHSRGDDSARPPRKYTSHTI